MKTTDKHYNDLVKNYKCYINDSINIGKFFGGPSLYFHNRALSEMRNGFLENYHIEMIYAMLSAWGMHRMGETKTKMVGFDTFKDSILRNKRELIELMDLKIETIKSSEEIEVVKKL